MYICQSPNNTWSQLEDLLLKEQILKYGTNNWVFISKLIPGRLARQCRDRWHNVLDPNIVRRPWTRAEDEFIVEMQGKIGSKWAKMSKMKPLFGRTVSHIKNRFYQNLMNRDLSKIVYSEQNIHKDEQEISIDK